MCLQRLTRKSAPVRLSPRRMLWTSTGLVTSFNYSRWLTTARWLRSGSRGASTVNIRQLLYSRLLNLGRSLHVETLSPLSLKLKRNKRLKTCPKFLMLSLALSRCHNTNLNSSSRRLNTHLKRHNLSLSNHSTRLQRTKLLYSLALFLRPLYPRMLSILQL